MGGADVLAHAYNTLATRATQRRFDRVKRSSLIRQLVAYLNFVNLSKRPTRTNLTVHLP